MPAQKAAAAFYPPASGIKVNDWLTLQVGRKNGKVGTLHEAVGFAAKT
jgi:hypothetical protein